MAGVFVSNLFRRKYSRPNLRQIGVLEQATLAIATGQYAITYSMPSDRTMRWRSFDWILTTPMLLRTLHLLAKEKGFEGGFSTAAFGNLLMIVAGYAAEHKDVAMRLAPGLRPCVARKVFYALGVAGLLIVYSQVAQWAKYLRDQDVDTKGLEWFFYIGWAAYGVNFLNPSRDFRQVSFDVLDGINKGAYSLVLNSVIDTEFGDTA